MTKSFWHKKKYKKLTQAIHQAKHILLFTHINPDGDALGSLISLFEALKFMKKSVFPIVLDSVKHDLDFLPGVEQLIHIDNFPQNFDFSNTLAIAVDVADAKRMGRGLDLFKKATHNAQLDHHGTNNAYAQINHIENTACSTAIMVYDFICENHIPINITMASTLYTGIATDTGNFAFSNTNAHAFEAMIALSRTGLEISKLHYMLFRRKQLPEQRILGRALDHLTLFANGKAAYTWITKEDLIQTEADSEHTTIIVNNVVEIEGVNMAFFIHESKDEKIRCSFRCKEGFRVDEIARSFGGGGHVYASGASIDLPMDKAIPQLCKAIEEALNA